ncbi:MAG: ATP-grasp domain-containing protein [Candidatus Aenigmarchaeota archaeon]|nr:ATP-grasp domain-containing protein [Candidatus Aenigmarchaeota archaeon]
MTENSDPPPLKNGMKILAKHKIKLVGIAYSKAEREYFPTEEAYISEQEVLERAKVLQKILKEMGFEARLYPGDETIISKIQEDKPDLIVNLVDTVRGTEILSTCIPALLDLAQIPYTGSGMYTFTLSSNKVLMKELLLAHDIPTPKYQLIKHHNEPISKKLKYPLITKLNNYHGGVGITNDAISENEKHLRKRLRYLINTYKSSIVVEEFIQGKELSAIVLEGRKNTVYIGEKVFKQSKKRKYDFCSFDATWLEEDAYYYKKFDNNGKIAKLSKKAFDLLGMADYAKFDIRIDDKKRFFFIDCNANPALGPQSCDCAIGSITKLYDIPFKKIFAKIMVCALSTSNKYI